MDTIIFVFGGAGVILGIAMLFKPSRRLRLPFFLSILGAGALSLVRGLTRGSGFIWTDVFVVAVMAIAAVLEALASVRGPSDPEEK